MIYMDRLSLHRIVISALFLTVAIAQEISFIPDKLEKKKEGTSLTVTCQLKGPDGLVIAAPAQWSKVGSDGTSTVIGKTGRVSAPDHTLLIADANKTEDDGTYRCEVVNGGEPVTKDIALELLKEVKFVDAPKEQHPLETEEATIKCLVDGSGDLSIMWRREGVVIDMGTGNFKNYSAAANGQELIIKEYMKEHHDAEYTCTAVQGDLDTFIQQTIKVVGYSKPVLLDGKEVPPHTGKEDSDVGFSCQVAGTPTPVVKWNYKSLSSDEFTPIVADESKYSVQDGEVSTLTVNRLTDADDGSYQCVAENSVGSVSRDQGLTVLMKPTVVVAPEKSFAVGNDVKMTCAYDGSDATASWRREGVDLSRVDGSDEDTVDHAFYILDTANNEVVLHIKSLLMEDRGEYECVGSNAAGDKVAPFSLQVEYGPSTITLTPTDSPLKSAISHSVTLSCESDGIPLPTVEWMLPGGSVVEDGDGGVVITETEPTDRKKSEMVLTFESSDQFGNWTCKASNEHGSLEKQIVINQIEVPPALDSVPVVTQSRATYATFQLSPWDAVQSAPAGDGAASSAPEQITIVSYRIGPDETWETAKSVNYSWDPKTLPVKLRDLEPDSSYMVKFKAVNMAGYSDESEPVQVNTSAAAAPEPPQFVGPTVLECPGGIQCFIEWKEPESGGEPIHTYRLRYCQVTKTGDKFTDCQNEWASKDLEGTNDVRIDAVSQLDLVADQWFKVEVRAENELGESSPSDPPMYINPPISMAVAGAGVGTGGVVAIVIVLVLLVLLVIDAICYSTNQCGLIMCVCVNLCGKTPPNIIAKEYAVEEGGKMKDAEKPHYEHVHNGDQDHSNGDKQGVVNYESEQSPMITGDRNADL